jgi:hypothetical protein
MTTRPAPIERIVNTEWADIWVKNISFRIILSRKES